jgi:thymidylate kinase
VDRLKNEVITNKENNQPVVSVLYHLLVWAESLVLYLWFKMTPGLVIHDRWPYDFLLQFRHRRYGNRLIYKLFSAFPSPDTLVWLRVEPAIAYQRKRTDPGHLEDGLDYFENLDAWMIEFASHRAYDAVICADASADIVAADLERVIRGRMTDRGGA